MVSSIQSQLISASLSPAQLGSEISSSIASKTLQASQQEGAGILQLIDSANPQSPSAGDPLVARATGLGSQLDIEA